MQDDYSTFDAESLAEAVVRWMPQTLGELASMIDELDFDLNASAHSHAEACLHQKSTLSTSLD